MMQTYQPIVVRGLRHIAATYSDEMLIRAIEGANGESWRGIPFSVLWDEWSARCQRRTDEIRKFIPDYRIPSKLANGKLG